MLRRGTQENSKGNGRNASALTSSHRTSVGSRNSSWPSSTKVKKQGQGSPVHHLTNKDFWEFDQEKGPWCRFHFRPRKRLFAPVGNDYPFNASAIGSKRVTEWHCKNRVSNYADNWQDTPKSGNQLKKLDW